MDFLDLIIIALGLFVAYTGYRRGVSWVGPSLVGLFMGILVGALLAPPLAHWIGGHNHTDANGNINNLPAMLATGFFLFFVFVFQGVGTALGFRLRMATVKTKYARVDSVAGSILAILGILVSAWYVGLTFAQSSFAGLDYQIQKSAIVRTLNSIAPTRPPLLAQIQSVLGNPNNFSGVFAGIAGETSFPPAAVPTSVNTVGVRNAQNAVVKVLSTSSECGGVEAGSGWPLAAQYIVTNAHVVAGGDQVEVLPTNGANLRAEVVLFDPDIDVAILYVPDANFTPLPVASDDPAPQTQGAVVGYPHGGSEQVVPAAVRGIENARGYNIYNSDEVTRTIEVLDANVVPGNSGGPMVDLNGNVIGLVFAASTTESNVGYALSLTEITNDLNSGNGQTSAVDTGGCTN